MMKFTVFNTCRSISIFIFPNVHLVLMKEKWDRERCLTKGDDVWLSTTCWLQYAAESIYLIRQHCTLGSMQCAIFFMQAYALDDGVHRGWKHVSGWRGPLIEVHASHGLHVHRSGPPEVVVFFRYQSLLCLVSWLCRFRQCMSVASTSSAWLKLFILLHRSCISVLVDLIIHDRATFVEIE